MIFIYKVMIDVALTPWVQNLDVKQLLITFPIEIMCAL
jgi:hypothetical protein